MIYAPVTGQIKDGIFEIYVDRMLLQTFNNVHKANSTSTAFRTFRAVSLKNKCVISNIKIYNINL